MERKISFMKYQQAFLKKGETSEVAIEREVLEETGFKPDLSPIYLGEFFVNPTTQNNIVISFLILNAYQAAAQELDATENIYVFVKSIQEIDSMISSGIIEQMFSVLALLLAKRKLPDNMSV